METDDLSADRPFGELLKQLRIQQGLSLETLAAKVGKTKGYLSLVENGRRAPSPALIERLATIFGGDLNDWMFLAVEREKLKETLGKYPEQVRRFLRTEARQRKSERR